MTALPLFDAAQRDRAKAAQCQDRMLAILTDGRWYKGRELCALLHTNERVLRQCASASRGRILSGQQGYRLTRYATTDEIDHAEAWLLSQARQMTDRAREIRIARNRGGEAA